MSHSNSGYSMRTLSTTDSDSAFKSIIWRRRTRRPDSSREMSSSSVMRRAPPSVEQQAGVALYAGEGRAQLVAHGGDDLDAGGGLMAPVARGPQGQHRAAERAVPVALVRPGDERLHVLVVGPAD